MQQNNRPMGQVSCNGCRVTLAYPLGAPSVRCPMCSSVTPVQQIHVSCVCCRTVLVLPVNTSVAMCPRCRTIMSIPVNLQRIVLPPGSSGAPPQGPPPPPKECVYVERPALKDRSGKHVNNIAIGTKLENDPY